MAKIILMGKSNTGKSTTAKMLNKIGFKTMVTDTTRPMRPGEVDGIDYNFRTEKEFKKRIQEGYYLEYKEYDATFGHCYYGSPLKNFSVDNTVTVLTPAGVRDLKKSGLDGFLILLLELDSDEIKRRATARGDKPQEIERRTIKDAVDFKDAEEMADIIISCNNRTPKQLADIIKELANKADAAVAASI